jgi:hypothetical protein
MDRAVGLVYDPLMQQSHAGPDIHPECPQRVSRLWAELQKTGLADRCKRLKARPVSGAAAARRTAALGTCLPSTAARPSCLASHTASHTLLNDVCSALRRPMTNCFGCTLRRT